MTEMAMVIVIYLGLAMTQYDKEHIQVVMLIEKFPWRFRIFLDAVISAFTTALCVIVFYAGILQAGTVGRAGLTTSVLFIPPFPFFIVMTVGFGVLMVVLAYDTFVCLYKGIKNLRPEQEHVKEAAKKIVEETLSAIAPK
jgi:TRAP-type C4-dicarboxylate transport system permease small subunit